MGPNAPTSPENSDTSDCRHLVGKATLPSGSQIGPYMCHYPRFDVGDGRCNACCWDQLSRRSLRGWGRVTRVEDLRYPPYLSDVRRRFHGIIRRPRAGLAWEARRGDTQTRESSRFATCGRGDTQARRFEADRIAACGSRWEGHLGSTRPELPA